MADERQQATFERMQAILVIRREEYDTVRRQVLVALHQPDPLRPPVGWWLMHGRVTAIRHGEKVAEPITHRYPSFVYDEVFLSTEDAIAWLRDLTTESKCEIAGHRLILRSPLYFSHRYDTKGYDTRVGYPCDWFNAGASEVSSWDSRPLLAADAPPYPTMSALAHHRMGVDDQSQSWMGQLHVLLPSYGAKIADVAVRRTRVGVRLLLNAGGSQSYLLRLWARREQRHFHGQQAVNRTEVLFRLPKSPDRLALFLVDTQTNSLVDQWGDWHTAIPSQDPPQSARAWKQRIAKGEDQELEFKNYADPRNTNPASRVDEMKTDDVAEVLVAFANTDGGILLVGVDDDRLIHGVDNVKKTRAKLLEIASHNCDPPITPKLFLLRFGEKVVVGATVARGSGIGQTNRRGVMIRRGETTRRAHSSELNQIRDRTSLTLGLFGHRRR